MIRLYSFYLVIGLILARATYVPFAPETSVLSYVAMASSILLFSVVSVIALRKPKLAAILAIVTLAGIFHYIWMLLNFMQFGRFPLIWVINFVSYFVLLAASLIVVLKKNKTPFPKISKPLLIGLSVAPPAILVFWVILITVRFGNFHIT